MAGIMAKRVKNSAKNSRNSVEKGVTLIAANTEVIGDVKFVNQLYINGHVAGNLVADMEGDANVVVSEEGSVAGEIRVPNVVINGKVEGHVYAGNRIELAAKAVVVGNVYYKLIEMQLGAMVDGQMVHDEAVAGGAKPNIHPFPSENVDNTESAAGSE